MEDYKLICVKLNKYNKLDIENPTNYPLIGKGGQGAVFRIDEHRCIKIYADEKIAEQEKRAYFKTIGSPIMPRLYEEGFKYIIIEYINGLNLKDFLIKEGRMTKQITQELISMFNEMDRLGFLRRDESLRHILIKDNKNIKIVDHAYAFTLKNPFPVKMFKQLSEIGMLKEFIEQGFDLAPKLFKEFREAMPEFFDTSILTGGA